MQSWALSVVTEVLNIFTVFVPDLFYLRTAVIECCCCTWSHSMTHTHTHTHALGGTLLGERLARRGDLYLKQHIHKRQTSMLPAGFKPSIPASKRSQTCSFESAVTGISFWHIFQESVTHFFFVILPCVLCTRHNRTWPIRFLNTLFLERLPYQRWI
jgi:hypothetical protein